MTPSPASRDDITSERRETKYLVSLGAAGALVSVLHKHLPLHRFTGPNANPLPGAHHYVTTIYFDTPSGQHYRAAAAGARSVKVRAREYYDMHPSLAEVATSSRDLLRYDPWLWFELKRRSAGRSEKRRFRLGKRDVPAFFEQAASRASTPPRALAERDALDETNDELKTIEAYLRHLDEPLSATCLVNYRRVAWQSPDASLRITLDLGLSYYAPPADLFAREQPLERELLGKPASVMNDAVVEVKSRVGEPAWLLAAFLRANVAPVEFSKFVAATRSIRSHV
ncbi:MAG TPA: polyphosphate polymerase domain-containing protein [Polyangiaceae bacterium]